MICFAIPLCDQFLKFVKVPALFIKHRATIVGRENIVLATTGKSLDMNQDNYLKMEKHFVDCVEQGCPKCRRTGQG